jgi:hypothetical protein
MNPKYLRMLVFQPTGHVVWVHEESHPVQGVSRRIPNIGKELDYVIFDGPVKPAMYNWYNEFKNYRLISQADQTIGVNDLPKEFADTVKLMRAKCYAMFSVITNIEIMKEQFDLTNNPIVHTSADQIAEVYQAHLGINNTQAHELIKFKQAEIKSCLERINLAEIEAELLLINATTLAEVHTQYNLIINKFHFPQAVLLENVL